MVLQAFDKQETGERVRKIWRLSGLTARELAKRMGSSDSGLVNKMVKGEARVAERLAEVAMATRGCGMLADETGELIHAYLRGDIPLRDQPVKSPSNGGRQTLDRVKEPTGWSGNVTTGVRAS